MLPANGFLCIDKPAGPSSFAIVARCKRLFSTRKVGHAGTLDPDADGVLVIAINDATRLLAWLPLAPKEYLFSMQFGTETDTLDSSGTTVRTGGTVPTHKGLLGLLPEFTGSIRQVPPRHSAVKIDGVRAYSLARKNREFELSPRTIRIESLELCSFNEQLGRATLKVRCSTGTYVRSLARDLAAAAGTFGHTVSITRTVVGPFTKEAAWSLERLERTPLDGIISVRAALKTHWCLTADQADLEQLAHGRAMALPSGEVPAPNDAPAFVFNAENRIAAVCRHIASGHLQPIRVFAAATAQNHTQRPSTEEYARSREDTATREPPLCE